MPASVGLTLVEAPALELVAQPMLLLLLLLLLRCRLCLGLRISMVRP
jgi:hypothetical protein